MTIHVSTNLEAELRRLAGQTGRDLGSLVDEAIQQYLDAAAITDISPAEVAAARMNLAVELHDAPDWSAA